jgi:hypothetical protein
LENELDGVRMLLGHDNRVRGAAPAADILRAEQHAWSQWAEARKINREPHGRQSRAGQAELRTPRQPIHLSPQSVAVLNMEKLGILESREQPLRLSYISALSELMSDASPLPDEMSNALHDLGLRTIELSLQLNQVFHFGASLRPKPSCSRLRLHAVCGTAAIVMLPKIASENS